MRIGFAMGGGGALSLSFIPILKGLQKENIFPVVVSGISMGAIIGALYCMYRDASAIEEIVHSRLQSPVIKDIKDASGHSESGEKMKLINRAFKFVKEMSLWNVRVIKNFLINPAPFMELFEDMFERKRFEDLKIPLRVVSTDLRSCQPVVFREGSLIPAITSTISMPGFFPPFEFGKYLLVDGGVVRPCPVQEIRKECDFLVAFVSKTVLRKQNFDNMLDVMFYSDLIRDRMLLEESLKEADFVFCMDFDDLRWADFDSKNRIFNKGRDVFADNIEKLLQKMRKARVKNLFRFFS